MASIELKSLDRLIPGDVLFTDAGNLIKAGREIDDRTIREFAKCKVLFVPIVSLSYEDSERSALRDGSENGAAILKELIQKRESGPLNQLISRLLDKINTFYVPFDEGESVFSVRGKKKQITRGKLLEKDPGPLYRDDIGSGSQAILKSNDMAFVSEVVKQIYKQLENLRYLSPETKNDKKKAIKRLNMTAVMLQSRYENDRLRTAGNATAWQAIMSALYFLYAMTNLNKKRIEASFPLAEARFDPDQSVTATTKVRYPPGRILDAVIGILLSNLGYSHQLIHRLISARPILDSKDTEDKKKIRLIQRSVYVCSHLLDRQDISSVSRMMCTMRYRYSDGTGFPRLNENKTLHEFIRLFQIIDFYTEMTNPVLQTVPYSRAEVIDYLQKNSGEYRHKPGKFEPQPRFDESLLGEFLQILKPFESGEKVYLYPRGKRNEPVFVGRVYAYIGSHMPMISILKDEKHNKTYRYGELLFDLQNSTAFHMKNGKIAKRGKMDWIGGLEIFDKSMRAGQISEDENTISGDPRVLSKRLRV